MTAKILLSCCSFRMTLLRLSRIDHLAIILNNTLWTSKQPCRRSDVLMDLTRSCGPHFCRDRILNL